MWLKAFYTEINGLLDSQHEGDRPQRVGRRQARSGSWAATSAGAGMVDDPSTVINLTERIAKPPTRPVRPEVILMAHELR
jgi:hypothetical protein